MKKVLTTVSFAFLVTFVFGQLKVIAPNGDVGVGISTPSEKLEVSGNFRINKAIDINDHILIRNEGTGNFSKVVPTGGAVIDFSPKPLDGTSNSQFRFFRNVNTSGDAAFVVHNANGSSAFNCKFRGNGNSIINKDNGDVGIGTTGPTAKLSVNGDANKIGGGSWTVFSDERLKKNVKEFSIGLDAIMQIRPVSYSYNGKAGIKDTEKEYIGIIAQEMREIAPYTIDEVTYQEEIVDEVDGVDQISYTRPEKYLTYNESALTYLLVNSIQEQQTQIEDRNEQIAELEERLGKLEEMVIELSKGRLEGIGSIDVYEMSLGQNTPNPFNEITNIKYSIPHNAESAHLNVYNLEGVMVKSVNLETNKKGSIDFRLHDFSSGAYTYSLIVDGKVADTKKMVLSK